MGIDFVYLYLAINMEYKIFILMSDINLTEIFWDMDEG